MLTDDCVVRANSAAVVRFYFVDNDVVRLFLDNTDRIVEYERIFVVVRDFGFLAKGLEATVPWGRVESCDVA